MLVLSRKPGEKLRIADEIVVEVVAIEGHRVRLGISAPPEVPIVRSELLQGKSGSGTVEEFSDPCDEFICVPARAAAPCH